MAERNNLGDRGGDQAFADKLTQMGDRTSLMIIDATLKSLPTSTSRIQESAADVAALARRMIQATRDYRETLSPAVDRLADRRR